MKNLVGKKCVFRTYSAGVHIGELAEREGKECLVKNSRRVYYWDGACSLSQLAKEGSKCPDNCKISVTVDEILLTEVIEIIPMTEDAIKNIDNISDWKSS